MALSERSESNGPIKRGVLKTLAGWFYILRLKSGKLYPGSTTNLQRRYDEHCRGVACRTTKTDPPLSIVLAEEHPSFSAARLREAQVKRWTLAKKEALVSGDMEKLHKLAKRRKR